MYLTELRSGKTHRQKTTVSFDNSYDLIVVGLGTTGAIAAISAAENGARVLGLERINMCGGSGTAGGVCGYYFGLQGGRFESIDQEANALREKSFVNGGYFHPDCKGIILEQAMLATDVEISYDTTLIGIYSVTDDEITGVRIITPQGVKNIECKILIDASGNGEACAIAGADYEFGRKLDNQPQPFSSVRIFINNNGSLGMTNFDAGYVSPIDGEDMTRGIIFSNSLYLDAIGADAPNSLWISTIPGVREGRLIECDEKLTFNDFMSGKLSDKPVAYCYSNYDTHSTDFAFEDEDIKDWMIGASLWGKNFVFPIPLETMLVKGFKNLMAVGRCMSVDHKMACAIRMQRGMQKLGQAAGTAAALATTNDLEIRKIDRDLLVSLLQKDNCLDSSQHPDCSFPENPAELKQLLMSDKPGEAIWYLAKNFTKLELELLEWVKMPEVNLSRNTALALGIAGREEALPTLRLIVSERDDFMPSSNHNRNYARIIGAIHLLGKIKSAENIDLLLDFIKTPELPFQEFSHTLMSLLKSGRVFHDKRELIVRTLEKIMMTDEFDNYKLLLKNSSVTESCVFEPMANLMRIIVILEVAKWDIKNNIIKKIDRSKLTWREQLLLEI